MEQTFTATWPDGSPKQWEDGEPRSWGNGFTHGMHLQPHGYVIASPIRATTTHNSKRGPRTVVALAQPDAPHVLRKNQPQLLRRAA